MKARALVARLLCRRHVDGEDGVFDPDERWSNQYRERQKNSIYRWVGVRSGGELIAVYERDGEEGVLQFAQEKMESMMYNEGQQTQLIKFADYVRWRKAVNVALGIPAEDQTELNEAQSRFHEHEAQWRLNKRGMQGETLIHLLLNRQELVCQEVARILITKYPGLAKDIYLGEDLFGQSCLHLAIVHDDYDTVQLLLEYGASVNARATGDFFLPEDYEPGCTDYRSMEYNGYAYYGEYPLAFAACFENKDIYDLLVQYGANPDNQDMFGSSTLHMCVIHNKNAMYSYAVRHWHKPGHTHIVNHAGQSPLTLATKLGRQEIFEEMMDLMKVEFWRFSDMTCSAYPLDALDTIRPDGSTNYDSALMTVISGDNDEHLEMINSEVIQRLLADKWKAFAERKLIERLALLAVHLLSLCLLVYLRPAELSRLYLEQSDSQWTDWLRTGAECAALGCTCWFFIQQIVELRTQGLAGYLQNLNSAPSKIVYIVSNLCLLCCVPLRFLHYYQAEDALMAFALPGSWAYLLFFARTTKLIGPFVQMIYTMMAGDLLRFGLISIIFMVPFSQTMFFLGKDILAKQHLPPDDDNHCQLDYDAYNYDTLPDTFLTLVRICMNGIFYEELDCANYQQLMKALFVLFIFLMFIMMITILIAMINNTYIEMVGEAELTWRQQRAKVIMVIERGMDKARLAACQLDYSVPMNEPGREARGLMVIKQTNKTRAQQRKQALANWKTIGRKVITMAKELGTLSTKYLLHSHDRLVTDDTVTAAGGAGGGNSGRYGGGSTGRPYSVGTALVSRGSNTSRRPSKLDIAEEFEQYPQYNPGRRRSSRAEFEEQIQQVRTQLEQKQERRPSVPLIQHPRLSIPGLALLDHQQSALRKIVTHATVNSMKLKQAQEAAEKQKILLSRPGAHQRKNVLHNGVVLPGVADAARRVLHQRRPSTALAEVVLQKQQQQLQRETLAVPSAATQHAHLTQRHMSPQPGVQTRGVDMLPSVDVPNIPAAVPRTGYAGQRRHTGDSLLQGGRKLLRNNSNSRMMTQHHAIDLEAGIPMATLASSTTTANRNAPSRSNARNSLQPAETPQSNTRIPRRVRPDLFRAKNSPPTQNAKNNNSPDVSLTESTSISHAS